MRRPLLGTVPRWKLAIASGCVLYMLLAWVMPLFMLPFVNVLPFVHERDAYERVALSAVGSVLVLSVLVALDPRRVLDGVRSQAPRGKRWKSLSHWLGVALGFGMFTVAAGAWSANALGLLARVLPGHEYHETVVLDSVDFSDGSTKYKAASLRYRSTVDGRARYLVISKRLFDYPRFSPGDVLELRGKAGLAGVYVTDVRRQLPQ